MGISYLNNYPGLVDHTHAASGQGGNTLVGPTLKGNAQSRSAVLMDNAGTVQGNLRVHAAGEIGFTDAAGVELSTTYVSSGVTAVARASAKGRWWIVPFMTGLRKADF